MSGSDLAGMTCTQTDHSWDGTVRDELGRCPKCEREKSALRACWEPDLIYDQAGRVAGAKLPPGWEPGLTLSQQSVERVARRVVELIAERWPEAAEDGAA